ncbi:hypothetical protein [Geobacter sp.]|uniref:hypothetical protein n=1 Tax=Geobacter sp. TaxID=46610 RepID=UPI00260E5B49|nr:hypothetical protein [Geobacter sp.]
MKAKTFFWLILILVTTNICGCGFGGFSGGGSTTEQTNPTDTDTKISGVVSKGLFKDGYVKVYAVNPDRTRQEISIPEKEPIRINSFGNYSTHISSTKTFNGSYSGVVEIEATGTYTDEATAVDKTVTTEEPLRALIANPTDKMKVAVTPLTELAAQIATKGSGTLTADKVNSANALISDLFKVDIIATQPVALTGDEFLKSGTDQAQKDYTLALAAISQLAKNGKLSDVLTTLATDLADDGAMSAENAAAFQTALKEFLASDRNPTVVKDIRLTNLANAGGTTRTVKVTTTGEPPPGFSFGGFVVTVELPQGVTLKADFSGEAYQTLSGVVTTSATLPQGIYPMGNYIPPSDTARGRVTVGMVSGSFGIGELLTIKCDVPAGTPPPISDFKIVSFDAALYDPNNGGSTPSNDGPNGKFINATVTE